MSDIKPPLPVLVGQTISTSREPGNPLVKLGYVTRDIVFSLGYGVAVYMTRIYIAGYVSPNRYPLFDKVSVGLMAVMGYTLVASWGRQPMRSRALRLFYDVIGLELVYHGMAWIFLGTQILMTLGVSISRMVIANLIVAGIGMGISYIVAPYMRTASTGEDGKACR